jgi:hypothetical protein
MMGASNWRNISLEDVYDLLDAADDANDIVHELVAIDGFDLEFSAALHALLVVALLAAEAVVVAAGDDGDGIVEFVAEWALDLRDDAVV